MSENAMRKYLIQSKLGVGRDFHVFDDEEGTNKIYFVDGKAGLGSHADIKDANDEVIYIAKGKIVNIPRKMDITKPDGTHVAKISGHISPLKSKMSLELADGKKWKLEGNLMHKHYQVKEGDKVVINIDQKWLTVRDKYYVEIAEDADLPLALGVIWTVDAWREGKNN